MSVRTVEAVVVGVPAAGELDLMLDLGWFVRLQVRCKLIGIDPRADTIGAAGAGRVWMTAELADFGGDSFGAGAEVLLISHEWVDRVSYGQIFLTTSQGDRVDLGLAMVEAGHATMSGSSTTSRE